MLNNRWTLLDEMRSKGELSLNLPGYVFAQLADRLEELLGTATREPLLQLNTQLGDLFGELMRMSPTETRLAVRGGAPSDSAVAAAFTLGQLNFAHLLTGQASVRRVDEEFLNCVHHRRYRRFIEALANEDRTGVELAKVLQLSEEAVSRNLKTLRESGVTDFRREGKNTVNFLTPAARAMLDGNESIHRDAPPAVMNPGISNIVEDLPLFMRATQTFSAASHDNSYALAA